MRLLSVLAAAALLATACCADAAQTESRMVPARDLAFTQKLDAAVPLDVPLIAEDGSAIKLKDALAGRPAILALVYYGCPRVCGLVLEGITRGARGVQGLDAGVQYQVIAVSFDPRETPSQATEAKIRALRLYDRPSGPEGFRFLTGTEAAVKQIANSIGFSYRWDTASAQFAHPAGAVVLTPEGRTARYFYGIDFQPKDLKLALLEASAGKIGSLVDQVLLFCYGFDEHTGQYTFLVIKVIRVAATLTLCALLSLVWYLRRRERARSEAAA